MMKKLFELPREGCYKPLHPFLRMAKVGLLFFVLSLSETYAANTPPSETPITLNTDQSALTKVLQEIENQTGFYFVYNNNLIDVTRKISISVKNQNIKTVLDLLFKNTDVRYIIKDKHIVLSNQQENKSKPTGKVITVKGKVTSSSGETLPGVTVAVVGSPNGTITDENGNYTLSNIQDNSLLSYTFLGMKTLRINVDGRSTLHVILEEETTVLDEVVAIGYGTLKRKEVTGTVSSLQARDIAEIPVSTAAEAITGKLAGVQVVTSNGSPDADIKIRIRGGGSITQDNSPLYIIDGFPVENGLSLISPSDIERIDVLKDAASTAIYGARGANGVVLITTKSGKEGRTNVSFDAYAGIKNITKHIDMMTPYDYVVSAWERTRMEANDLNATSMTSFISRYGSWDTFKDRYSNDSGTDWQDETFRTGVVQNYTLSINGGNKTTKYNLGLSHIDDEGIILGSSYNRTILNGKLEHKANEHLTVGFSTRYNNNKTYGGTVSTQNILMYRPTEGLTGSLNYDDFDEEYLENNDLINPVLLTNEMYNKKTVANYNLMGEASYKLGDFIIKTQAGIDSYQLKNQSFDGPHTKNALKNNGPFVSWSTTDVSKWINTNTINWSKKSEDDKHNFGALLGQEWSDARTNLFSITVKEFPDYITPEKAFGSLSFGDSNDKPSTSESSYQLFSFFGRASYDYMGKYLINASLRTDGSSKFAKQNRWGFFPSVGTAWRITEENFMEPYDVVSNLKFRYSFGMSGNDRISDLMWTTPWVTDATTQYGVNNVLSAALKPSSLANPDVKWETTISNNIGLDFGFFKNRLNVTTDLYNNETKDLLLDSSLPANAGFSTQTKNIGRTRNRGFELSVDGILIDKKNFFWSAGFNISFNRNKVLALSEGVDTRYQSSDISTAGPKNEYRIKVGEPIGQMYGYVYDGWYTADDFVDGSYNAATKNWKLKDGVAYETAYTPRPGDIKFKNLGGATDANGNPIITDEDKTVIGNANPTHFGGFNTSIRYKNFDLSAFFNWSYGNDVYNATKLNLYNGKNKETNMPSEMAGRYTLINDLGEPITDLETLTTRNQNATTYSPYRGTFVFHSGLVEDGSFLRLNNLTLGYTVPKSITSRVLINNLRVYVTGHNLFCWSSYSGFDPEVNALTSTTLTPGADYWSYPKNRSFIAGINLTF
jgi:TonB-dependent starch-binding outer membrane protein SusC